MAPKFNIDRCRIPKVYCGKGDWKTSSPNKYSKYYKKGTNYECLRSGIGAGMMIEKKKSLSKNSLQNIPYVGPVYEANFKKKKITTLSKLEEKVEDMKTNDIKKLLEGVFTKSNGNIDYKGMNSTILYLYGEGYHNMPECKRISEE